MDLGGHQLESSFALHSHGWGPAMNRNLVKMAFLTSPSVLSYTTPLPASANDGDAYVDPATGQFNIWLGGEWNTIAPWEGAWVYVKDDNVLIHYDDQLGWRLGIDLNVEPGPTPRSLAFYAPEALRPNATIFSYACGQEFTLPQNAPQSVAECEVAPTADVVLSILVNSTPSGTITFASGSTDGVIDVPDQIVLLPVQLESQFSRASRMSIRSPQDVAGMRGLSVTLRGVVRPPQEG